MGIFLEFLKVEMKEGILLMVTSLFIEQISRAIENHKSKTNPNAVNLEGSTITEDKKKRKRKRSKKTMRMTSWTNIEQNSIKHSHQ